MVAHQILPVSEQILWSLNVGSKYPLLIDAPVGVRVDSELMHESNSGLCLSLLNAVRLLRPFLLVRLVREG
jgi:hypothetical protein